MNKKRLSWNQLFDKAIPTDHDNGDESSFTVNDLREMAWRYTSYTYSGYK